MSCRQRLLRLILIPFVFTLLPLLPLDATTLGIDHLFESPHQERLKGKNIGVITNQTALNSAYQHLIDLLQIHSERLGYKVTAIFSPEHGLFGDLEYFQHVQDAKLDNTPAMYSLYGARFAPTQEMLKTLDLLIYDIQDLGTRPYSFASTLFLAMEKAKEARIPILVLDRPNPIGGSVVDGPLVHEQAFRSRLTYINVPYCHGMTIAEQALFFNREYHIHCQLHIVPLENYTRDLTYSQLKLPWVPPSPNIPTPQTALVYPITGFIGEAQGFQNGIGTSTPFQLFGAPFINATLLSQTLNAQNLPGITFTPHQWTPHLGSFRGKLCRGVFIHVTDPKIFRPIETAFTLIGICKSLYPKQVSQWLEKAFARSEYMGKVLGSLTPLEIIQQERFPTFPLKKFYQKDLQTFLTLRENYLLYPTTAQARDAPSP